MKKRICIVTATRAEYGLLRPLIVKMKECREFDVSVAVTGMHLSPEFGLTYREIEADGITIDKKIEILLSADTSSAISKSMALALIGFSDYFRENPFDAAVILGDRYEMLAVACAAMNARIPIIHLYGGETTEGAVDEEIRHAITKLSYFHFTSTEEYRKRVIQMGENPDRVFCVGALGVENALQMDFLSKEELEKELQFSLERPFVLVTFHPVTLEAETAGIQMRELLDALDEFQDWGFIMTRANADAGGRIINQMMEEYAGSRENVRVYKSLGSVRYLSAMKYCRMVIGNSSSGLIEVPSFGIPTINIGDRQRGRVQAESVVNCIPRKEAILAAIRKADTEEFRRKIRMVKNPYGTGNTSEEMVRILRERLCGMQIDLKKKFFDVN